MKHKNTSKTGRSLAVVTGASSGIGYELAKVFAKNNFDLLLAAEDAGIAEAGNAVRGLGAQVETIQVDLATFEGVERLYQKIKDLGRNVSAIAINAGIGVYGKFAETFLQDELRLIQLNVISTIHLTKRLLPDMISAGEGKILFTSSIAAEMPGPYYACYAASKSFIQSFSEAIRYELRDTPITVTALQPGATDTNFFARAGMLDTEAGQAKKDDPAKVALDGFNALMRGKDHVVAGSYKNKIQASIAKLLPETKAAEVHASGLKPKHH